MTDCDGRSWYGDLPSPARDNSDNRPGVSPGVLLALAFVALVWLRLLLPWADSDLAIIHQRAMRALAEGRNWGRQTLFASFEFPPLAMLGMLAIQPVAELFATPPAILLTAVCQAWTLLYFLRIPQTSKGRLSVFAVVLAGLSVPYASGVVVRLDPNWVIAVPLAGILFHLTRWEEHASLRDIVAVSICLGLLVFGGIAGASLAFILTVAATAEVMTHPNLTRSDRQGTRWLIWAPVAYCVALMLLFNWLIMGNPLVPFKVFFSEAGRMGDAAEWMAALGRLPRWVLPLAVALVFIVRRHRFGLPSCLLLSLASVLLAGSLSEANGVFPSGVRVALTVLGTAALVSVFLAVRNAPSGGWRRTAVCLCLVAAGLLAAFFPASAATRMDTALKPAPPATAVARIADRQWKGGRILVYGIRMPAAFPDRDQRRFVASVDYHLPAFLSLARREQVFVLVPPAGWRQPENGPESPARVRLRGGRTVLLEQVFPGGWQLWRCVLPPRGESRWKNQTTQRW